jgi:4-hydroxy-tetrahydrodipicolinate synthase
MFFELLPLFKASFIETNPVPIKAMMSLCGISMSAACAARWPR